MEAQVAAAMEAGAFGLSTSLQYVPDRFARTDELVALARVAGRYGGSYITHQRSEADAIDDSLDEVFRIAREAGVPATIHHLKTAYQQNWGRMPQVLARIERARAERPRHRRRSVSRTSPAATRSTPACRCGRARAGARRWSRG